MESKEFHSTDEAIAEAMILSKRYPKKYFIIYSCFGLYVSGSNRLNVFAPSDSYLPYYFLSGKKKPFTKAQKIADQNATPQMS